jgi:transcriptional regulator with GAF, ATPase, and Fis domain
VLADHFLKKYSVQYNKPVASITPELQRSSTLRLAGETCDSWKHDETAGCSRMDTLILRELQQAVHPAAVSGFRSPLPRPAPTNRCSRTCLLRLRRCRRLRRRGLASGLASGLAARSASTGPVALASAHGTHVGANGSPNGTAAPAPIDRDKANGSSSAGSSSAGSSSANVSLKDIARTAARQAERELILRMLTRTRWNRKEAAEILGISYKALLYKIKENGLDKAS